MQFGLFGKLQAKRDFIAAQVPRSCLAAFEPWMQSCISTSRMALGPAWQTAFLTAPIWRFWLGPDLCGTPVAGAFMPSMDGVGRYWPLAFMAIAGEGDWLPPPEIDACDAWYLQVEDFLLSTLDGAQAFETTLAGLARFAPPASSRPVPADHLHVMQDRTCIVGVGQQEFGAAFAQTRQLDPMRAHAASTFWWTAGGEGYAPHTLAALRMPDPYLFNGMLTGDFGIGGADREGEP